MSDFTTTMAAPSTIHIIQEFDYAEAEYDGEHVTSVCDYDLNPARVIATSQVSTDGSVDYTTTHVVGSVLIHSGRWIPVMDVHVSSDSRLAADCLINEFMSQTGLWSTKRAEVHDNDTSHSFEIIYGED